ncbi:MAG: hypothetical protein HYR56_32135 [Acidobacteria bacterium]|nr:hypothetical protein [Acidobacteriota bacterium]MBI3427587.1 hypothetical protein [Acidobacteriota bacterium]
MASKAAKATGADTQVCPYIVITGFFYRKKFSAAQILAVFRTVEQVSRLTDHLIAGNAAATLPQTARALLLELARLEAALTALEEN